MTVELIYHTDESWSGGLSPFDEAILASVTNENICIACPYLSLSYLKRITGQSRSWRVITDAEAWLASQNRTNRLKILRFVELYPNNFHHLKSLHAKVIVAGNKAIAGSANFTYSGVTSSAEMSVLFQEEPQVQELLNWFENLWCCSTSIDIAELQVYNDALPDEIQTSQPDFFPTLTCPAPPIKSRLRTISTSSKTITANEDAVDLLIERIKITPNRQWINSYFELMKTILEATGLTSDDPRLVTSIPSGRWFLPMTINNRYILAPSKKRGSFIIGVIFGPEYAMLPEVQAETISDGQFSPLRGENFLETPYFLRLADMTRINQFSQLKNGWIRAALLELERAKSSPYRKHHQPVVYEAAVNLDFRNMILGRAFPNV